VGRKRTVGQLKSSLRYLEETDGIICQGTHEDTRKQGAFREFAHEKEGKTMTISTEKYKGFELEYFIARSGFNQYKVTIKKYRNKGKRNEEYFMHFIHTYSSSKAEARKEAREFIDGLKHIEWRSQGRMK
jgi:hypothetical protein